ncbi:hypothetical protein ABZP36_032572 [Zizania latifolia]
MPRRLATTYPGRIAAARPSPAGPSITVAVAPMPLDPRGYPLPRRRLVCAVARVLRSQDSPSLRLTLAAAEASEVVNALYREPDLALASSASPPTPSRASAATPSPTTASWHSSSAPAEARNTAWQAASEAVVQMDVMPLGRYPLPRRHLVCAVARVLRSQDSPSSPLLDLADYLRSLRLTLTAAEVSEVVKALYREPDLALAFFRFAADSLPGFRCDAFSYNRILALLFRTRADPAEALRIGAEM